MLHFLLLSLLVSALPVVSSHRFEPADLKLLSKRGGLDAPHLLKPRALSNARNISMPVDHFNTSNHMKYNNRYFINDTYYQSGGPVFFLDWGESGITEAYAQTWLQEGNGRNSAVMQLARKYHGLAVMWEHRYFGESQPFPIQFGQGTYDELKYLTVEQALQDTVYVANHFEPKGLESHWAALSPKKTPWIWVGGSYPGARGAWARIRSPEIFHAVWASSAVVQSQTNVSAYYDTLYELMPKNCSVDMKYLVSIIDDTFRHETPQGLQAFKESFLVALDAINLGGNSQRGISSLKNINITQLAQTAEQYDWFGIWAFLESGFLGSFQSTGYTNNTGVFCDALESYNPAFDTYNNSTNITDYMINVLSNPGNATPSNNGLVGHNKPGVILSAMFYAMVKSVDNQIATYRKSIYSQDPYIVGDLNSWRWLTCNELGLWFIANPANPRNLISISSNETTWHGNCLQNFNFPQVPKRPKNHAALKYGGWNMNPSNVFFTDGQYDPWRAYTLESTEPFSPIRNVTSKIPQCGMAPRGNKTFGVVYDDAFHVPDLDKAMGTSNTPMDVGLKMFEAALNKWLPCFEAR